MVDKWDDLKEHPMVVVLGLQKAGQRETLWVDKKVDLLEY